MESRERSIDVFFGPKKRMQDEEDSSAILARISCARLFEEHSGGECQLVSAKCARLGGVVGFVGEFHNVTLAIVVRGGKETRQLQFFVKSLSEDPVKKEFAVKSRAWFKEERMFCEITPRLLRNGIHIISQALPRCFQIQPASLLVFEDLASKGYRTLNNREPLSLDCVRLTLDSLVKLHASVLTLEERVKHSLARDYEWEFKESFYVLEEGGIYLDARRSGLRGLATQIDLLHPKGEAREKLRGKIEEVFCDLHLFAQPSQRFRNSLCHGDLWIKNLMFQFEDDDVPKHCKLVDFQSYRYCPPAQDVMTFIYLTTDRRFRQGHLQEVLEYYHRRLSSAFEELGVCVDGILSRGDYAESCELYKKFAVVQAALHSHLTTLTPEGFEDFESAPGYKKKFFREDRSEHIVKWREADPVYRRKMIECLEDLQEVLVQ